MKLSVLLCYFTTVFSVPIGHEKSQRNRFHLGGKQSDYVSTYQNEIQFQKYFNIARTKGNCAFPLITPGCTTTHDCTGQIIIKMSDSSTPREQITILDVTHSQANSRTEEYERMISEIDMKDKRFHIRSYGNCCWKLYKR